MKYSFTSKHLLAALLALAFSASSVQAQLTFTQRNDLLPSTNIHSGVAIAVVDMNGDKLDDIVRLDDRRHLYVEYQTPGSMFTELDWGTVGSGTKWSMCVADVDQNGYNDIACGGAYNGVDLLMANGTGTDFTGGSFPNASLFVQGSNFADIDNDGWVDYFACHDDGESQIWQNDGMGGFTLANSMIDMTAVPSSDNSGNYGSTWTDIDYDGDLDLYIAKCRQGVTDTTDSRRINALFINDGNGNYTQDVANVSGLRNHWQSWTADFQDVDNDGDFDCFLTQHDHTSQIFENNGDGTFTERFNTGIDANALPIQGIFKDFDNDGFVDLIVGDDSDQQIYLNNGDWTFTDVSSIIDNGDDMLSYAVGDLNHDGFLDFYAGYGNAFNGATNADDILWLNDGNENHFLAFDLEGTTSNINAIGAKLELYGAWGIQVREIRSGESYGIMNSFTQHFGLGAETEADSLVIRWPSGTVETYYNLAADQFMTYIEGTCGAPDASVTADGPLTFCSGDDVTLTAASGGTYEWSTGATTQSITLDDDATVAVTVTVAGGCFSTSPSYTIVVDPEETPEVSISGDLVFCEGNDVTLTSSSASGYDWSNGETTQSITVDATGDYYVQVQGDCGMWSSDTVSVTSVAYPAAAPTADNVILNTAGSATLTANSGNNVHWFDVATGGNPIGQGSTFNTPVVSQSTTFYLEDRNVEGSQSGNAGKADNAGDGGGQNNPNFNGWLEFDAWDPFTIQKVTVYAFGAGDRTFQLYDDGGTVVDDATVTLVDGEQEVDLNFYVEAGNGWSLRVTDTDDDPALFRSNDDQPLNYPYPILDAGEITNANTSGNSSTAWYYYFYNWVVETEGTACASARNSVNVHVWPAGINEASLVSSLSLFPNPTASEVNLSIELAQAATVSVTVLDALGNAVAVDRFGAAQGKHIQQLEVANLAQGVYMVRVQVGDSMFTKRLIVE